MCVILGWMMISMGLITVITRGMPGGRQVILIVLSPCPPAA